MSDQSNLSQRAQSIPPGFAEEMRQRRPGYDQIYNLIQEYEAIAADERTQIEESLIAERFVRPMFQALGWSAMWDEPESWPLILEYRNLRIPVEVRKFGDPLSSYPIRQDERWGILTNFENISIFDLTEPDQPHTIDSSPWQYIADKSEENDLLAAERFYEKLVQPSSQQVEVTSIETEEEFGAPHISQEPPEQPETVTLVAPESGSTNQVGLTGELYFHRIPGPGFHAPVGSEEERFGGTIWPSSWKETLSFLYPLPEAPTNFSPGVRLAPNQTIPATHEVYAPANGQVIFAELASSGWFGTIIIESVLPNQTHIFSRISQLTEISIARNNQVDRGQLIGRIDFNHPDKYLRYEIAKSNIFLTEPFHWVVDNPLTIEEHYLNPTEFTRTNRPGSYPQVKSPPEAKTTTTSETRSLDIAIWALTDKSSKVDLLGFSDYAEALADFIKSEKTEKPLTIGIDAAWGMGKTTLMEIIQKKLADPGRKVKGEQTFPIVWFNAWKYDKEESLWAALVLEILTQVRQQMNWGERIGLGFRLNWKRFDWGLLWQKIAQYLIVYIFLIGILGATILGIASLWLGATLSEVWQRLQEYIKLVGGFGLLTALYAAGKQAFDSLTGPFSLKLEEYIRQPNYAERVGFLAQFETDFKRVIEVVTKKGKWPLVVFIDDLDRCAPPKPVEIIEAINLLLDSQHCVFILGMDAQTVASSIEAKYKDLLENLIEDDAPGALSLGQRFLEKIIQINFRIPKVNSELMASFVEANLMSQPQATVPPANQSEKVEAENLIQAEQRSGKTSVGEAVQAVQQARPDLPVEVITAAKKEVQAKSFDDSEETKQAIREAVPYLGFNPRKIKRFINLLRLQALIAHRRGLLEKGVIQLDLLGKWLLIATLWPGVIERLASDWDFVERLQEAYEIRERLNKAQYNHSTSLDRESDQNKLNFLLTDPLIKRLINEIDLIDLLSKIKTSKPDVFAQYLHLTQTSVTRFITVSDTASATEQSSVSVHEN